MKLFISKWVSQQTAVGEVMVQRAEREEGNCSCCGFTLETTLLVLQCPYPTSQAVWRKGRKKIKKCMKAQYMDPRLLQAINHIIQRFPKKDDYNTYVLLENEELIQRCLNAQSHLGWMNFFEGLLTTDWAVIQQHFTALKSQKTGNWWAVVLSTQLWKLVFSMQDHHNQVLHKTEATN